MTSKEKAEYLISKIAPNVQYWDCYNDSPLEYNHTGKIANDMAKVLVEVAVLGKCVDNIRYWKEVRAYIKSLSK